MTVIMQTSEVRQKDKCFLQWLKKKKKRAWASIDVSDSKIYYIYFYDGISVRLPLCFLIIAALIEDTIPKMINPTNIHIVAFISNG